MTNIELELLKKIQELKSYCEEHGFPLHELLEDELVYYTEEFLQD
jgi:hypothetical protein